MDKHDFQMIAIETRFREWTDRLGSKRRSFQGWSIVGRDIETVGLVGQQVKLEGTAGIYPAHVVKHDKTRKLIYVKHAGYTSYISRGTGNSYSPACFIVYHYDLRAVGNELHPFVGLFGIAELPLNWKPPVVDQTVKPE